MGCQVIEGRTHQAFDKPLSSRRQGNAELLTTKARDAADNPRKYFFNSVAVYSLGYTAELNFELYYAEEVNVLGVNLNAKTNSSKITLRDKFMSV